MTRVAVQDLVPNTGYKVQVRAVSDGDYSEWSEAFVFTTTQNSAIPVAPASSTWVASDDSFTGTWTEVITDVGGNSAMIVAYELELTAGATTKLVTVAAQKGTGGVFTLTFADNVALFGTPQASVSMRVRAVNNKNIKGNYTGSIAASNAVPANVTGFTATGAEQAIDLVWTANTDTDLDRYEIYVGTTSGFTPSGANRIFSGKVTRFTYITTTFTLQWFKIRAYDKFNQPSATDASSSATATSPFGADTTAPATPTGLAATITTVVGSSLATSAAVSWTANSESDLAGYFLRYRVNGTTPWNTIRYDKATTSAVVSNLTPYVNYDFQIAAVDWSENMSAYSATATGTGATNAAPSQPAAPTVSTGTLQAQVTVTGNKQAGGAMEADVTFYEVYGSTTTGFTPAAGNMLGTIAVGPAMIATFDIPASGGGSTETWFFKIIAVDNGGLKSTASPQVSGTPGLIQATNITNATITNAQINDLAANKITAGTGIINNLSVKSVLTIGDASTTGSIQSFDYSAGTAGYKIASVGGTASLEINQGTIRAPAIVLQAGTPNLMQPQYADFELNSSFYTAGLTFTGGGSATIDTTDKFFNSQSLKWTTAAASTVHLANNATTDFGMVLNPSTTYIISYYAMIKTGATASTVTPSIRWNTSGSFADGAGAGASVPANSTWNRYTTTVAIPGTSLGKAHLFFTSSAATTVYIDGIQVEEKMTAATTASTWNPPGGTTVNGYMIRTGSIVSSTTATVLQATPVYDTSGNLLYYGNPVPVTDPDGRPSWTINAAGAAEFSDLSIRGNAVMGDPNTTGGTTPFATTINTTSASSTIVIVAGDITVNDVGLTITSANLPGGTTIVSITDSTHAVVSANATATASGTAANVLRPFKYVTRLASANYISGTQGWVIRSDGVAEFQQVLSGTLNGAAIKAGSLTADAIGAGTVTADIALAGSFETTVTPSNIDLNTTSGSPTVSTTAGQFFPDDVGAVITASSIPANAVVTTYLNSTSVTISANATATLTGTDGTITRQRQVSMDSSGIRLTAASGDVIVNLPTDSSQSSSFSGSIVADSLLVQDLFQMQGTNNVLGTGSQLTMSSGDWTPGSPPNVTFSYTKAHALTGPGTNYSPNGDANATDARAFMYDPVNNQYYWCVTQWGVNFKRMWASTASAPYILNFDVGVYNAFISGGNDSPRAMCADASNFYFLTQQGTGLSATWRFQKITRTGVFRAGGAVAGDRVGANTWAGADIGVGGAGIMGDPGLSVYGGNLYAAKLNAAGKLVLTKYTGTSGTNTVDFTQTKSALSVQGTTIRSLTIGKFDMGGTDIYMCITTGGSSGSYNYMYKVDIAGTQFVSAHTDFQMVDDKNPVGTAWFAATTDTSSGNFETLCQDGTIGKYTGLGATTSGTSVQATMAWRNSNTTTPPGGLSPRSPYGTYTFRRRAILTLAAPISIPNSGGNSPDSVSFAMSVDSGTHFRYPDPATGVPFLTVTTLQTSDSTAITPSTAILSSAPVNKPLVTGTSSVITNNTTGVSAMSISGDGTIIAKSLALSTLPTGSIVGIGHGASTATANGSGQVVITHGLGGTPAQVFIQGQSVDRLYIVTTITSTTFTVTVRVASTNTLLTSGQVASFNWLAVA